jgi:hypothetical protein
MWSATVSPLAITVNPTDATASSDIISTVVTSCSDTIGCARLPANDSFASKNSGSKLFSRNFDYFVLSRKRISAHVAARIEAAGIAPMHCCTSPGTS